MSEGEARQGEKVIVWFFGGWREIGGREGESQGRRERGRERVREGGRRDLHVDEKDREVVLRTSIALRHGIIWRRSDL